MGRDSAQLPRPQVSVLLATHDRPEFMHTALHCFQHQTYPNRELIVVDDSREPADEPAILAAGGRVVRSPPGTPLGQKLNGGIAVARGELCQLMDDDDWYGPDFLSHMVSTYLGPLEAVCRPVLATLSPFLYFHVRRWTLLEDMLSRYCGATLLFSRLDGLDCPFRPVTKGVDDGLIADFAAMGAIMAILPAPESYLCVRHSTHSWTTLHDGRSLDDFLLDCPPYAKTPEEVVAPWAIDFYRALQSREEGRNRQGTARRS